MAWAAQGGRGQERVGLAPNGSLGFVSRHYAHRKCSRMGEAINIARMGPLQAVAGRHRGDAADQPDQGAAGDGRGSGRRAVPM